MIHKLVRHRANTHLPHLLNNKPSHQDKRRGRKQTVVVDKDLQREARANFAGVSAAVGPRRLLPLGVVGIGGRGSLGDSVVDTQSTISSPSSKHRRIGCLYASGPSSRKCSVIRSGVSNYPYAGGGKGRFIFFSLSGRRKKIGLVFFCCLLFARCAGPQSIDENACFLQTLGSCG